MGGVWLLMTCKCKSVHLIEHGHAGTDKFAMGQMKGTRLLRTRLLRTCEKRVCAPPGMMLSFYGCVCAQPAGKPIHPDL
eukprot:scaffold61245_cov17-Tisochrysis_lutea.AAC.1